MWRTPGLDEQITRHQLLAFLDEYCRGMTLQDVREWYTDAMGGDAAAINGSESGFLS